LRVSHTAPHCAGTRRAVPCLQSRLPLPMQRTAPCCPGLSRHLAALQQHANWYDQRLHFRCQAGHGSRGVLTVVSAMRHSACAPSATLRRDRAASTCHPADHSRRMRCWARWLTCCGRRGGGLGCEQTHLQPKAKSLHGTWHPHSRSHTHHCLEHNMRTHKCACVGKYICVFTHTRSHACAHTHAYANTCTSPAPLRRGQCTTLAIPVAEQGSMASSLGYEQLMRSLVTVQARTREALEVGWGRDEG